MSSLPKEPSLDFAGTILNPLTIIERHALLRELLNDYDKPGNAYEGPRFHLCRLCGVSDYDRLHSMLGVVTQNASYARCEFPDCTVELCTECLRTHENNPKVVEYRMDLVSFICANHDPLASFSS